MVYAESDGAFEKRGGLGQFGLATQLHRAVADASDLMIAERIGPSGRRN
jgi:hypothetical protein